jgi:SSS family solute:Na+ symporter
MPEKSIFWTQGIKMEKDGAKFGSGTLNLELILIDKLGLDLSENPYALNETIRVLVRTLVPFIILIFVALFTASEDKKRLDLFYVKMKTSVLVDHKSDAREMALSNANPHRFDHLKIRPNSNWEFYKWDKVDVIGFLISVLVVGLIIGMLLLAVSIGA